MKASSAYRDEIVADALRREYGATWETYYQRVAVRETAQVADHGKMVSELRPLMERLCEIHMMLTEPKA